MSPAHPQTHNRSPPSLAFSLTDVDQSCNIKLLGFAEPENYRHQFGMTYFLHRNPHQTHWQRSAGVGAPQYDGARQGSPTETLRESDTRRA